MELDVDASSVQKLRVNADRCRRLAESATDAEVARVLREMASDIEQAIPILEQHEKRSVG
jgi:hypothetical protein